jgi:hypothetical protein
MSRDDEYTSLLETSARFCPSLMQAARFAVQQYFRSSSIESVS